MDYDTPETADIIAKAVLRIAQLAAHARETSTANQREVLSEIRDIINDELKRYANAYHEAVLKAASGAGA